MRWDTIVVGAGSSGAVVASRLSEHPDHTVLLLEAGLDYRSAATPPSLASADWFQAIADDTYLWADLVASRAADSAPRPYFRGRGVGGSSAVNGLVALPALADDYDRWERESGAAGWGAAGMRTAVAKAWRSLGPELPRALGGVGEALVAAASGLGHAVVTHPAAEGVGAVPLTTRGGRRWSVNDAYLEPARSRANFTVRGGALVDRVLLDGAAARGVRLDGGEELESGRVVVAAGALHSPALLLRSGITRPGVGTNLADHPSFRCELALEPVGRATDLSRAPATALLCWSSAPPAPADVHVLAVDWSGVGLDAPSTGLLLGALLEVHSRGTVRLASQDPTVPPVVELDLLSDERDVSRLHRVVGMVAALLEQESFRSITREGRVGGDGRSLKELAADRSPGGWLRAGLGDYVHAAGTCRLGRPDDPLAVVDPRACVIGVDGLYVADASIMPTVPRANPHLACVAVGERVAELLTP